jgi:uroporphyrinogen-III decarboxylase
MTMDFTMTPRQRLMAVMRGQTPDRVPVLADLSWWYAAHGGGKYAPSLAGNQQRLAGLLTLHRRLGVGIHLNTAPFYDACFPDDIRVEAGVTGDRYVHRIETPVGSVEEVRIWSAEAWSWGIKQHMIRRVEDLKVIRYAYERIRYQPRWEDYTRVDAAVGDVGVPFACAPYTAMGFMISRYAGVEQTVMLAYDVPEELNDTLTVLNAAHERCFRLLADGPAPVLFVSDNLSSDVQSPAWFGQYSAAYYRRMAQIAHEHGKVISVHIDGRLRGLLGAMAECGIDAVDAVTPAPWGDLTPRQCRDEAGPGLILSGGVPPDSFAPQVPLTTFDAQVEAWLGLRHESPALIIAPGDQLPPSGEIERVTRLAQLADEAS